MDKVILTDSDFEVMYDWRNKHSDLLLNVNELPLHSFELICGGFRCKYINEGKTLTAYPSVNNNRICKIEALLTAPFLDALKLLGYNKAHCLTNPVITKTTKLTRLKEGSQEEYDRLCRLTVNYYTLILTYMAFGNSERTSTHEFSVQGTDLTPQTSKGNKKRNKKGGVTYIFQKRQYVSRGGHHASPSYEFTVRGHYRNYKNGKRIWIEQFQKGAGKHKSKVYKLGGI